MSLLEASIRAFIPCAAIAELSILDRCDATDPTRDGDSGLGDALDGADPGVRGLLGLGRCGEVTGSSCLRAASRSCILLASKPLVFAFACSAGLLILRTSAF
jgi:hypothetical protein